MIETTIPEVNVAELMERVRAEARRPKKLPPRARAAALPPVAMLPAAPAVWIPGAVKSRKARLDALAQTAREKNEPTSIIPKFLRRFFRKQGGYNRAVVDSIVTLSKATDDLTRRVGEMGACLEQFNSWLLALHEQSDADATWMKAAATGVSQIGALQADLANVGMELQSTRAEFENTSRETRNAIEEKYGQLAKQMQALDSVTKQQTAAFRERMEQIRQELKQSIPSVAIEQTRAAYVNLAEQTRDLRRDLDNAGAHLRNLQAESDSVSRQLGEFQIRHDQKTGDLQLQIDQAVLHSRGAADLAQRIGSLEERTIADGVLVKGQLSEYGALLRRLLDGDLTEPVAPANKSSRVESAERNAAPGIDSFYLAFENRFRGPRQEIKKRVAFYLPFLRKCRAGAAGRPVLDLGCGRGEWLELLKEEKLDGRGLDMNAAMIAQCKAHKLKVQMGDALTHLSSLRANSLGAVTGFHIIEHLKFGDLMELLSEARRVLKPGGAAIFESPNCKNLVVGACNFHIDPTHRHPVFPDTAEFMLASHGFEKIQIEYLAPVADVSFDATTKEMVAIKELLYGPQDFGIIAYKPKAR